MSILNILNEVGATASKLEKVAILTKHKDNLLLQEVFKAAYNPFINYYIKKIPDYTFSNPPNPIPLKDGIGLLEYISDRTLTGNAGIGHLKSILQGSSPDDAVVIERIIQRDLRIGASESTANKVWLGLIPTFDVMLSHKDISGIKFPCYGQIKSDGMRCHMSLVNGKAVALSRNGKTIELLGVMDSALASIIKEGETIDGELLCYMDGKVLDRQTGNGILNKCVKGTITQEEANLIHFAAWDIVDFSSTIPYNKRIAYLYGRMLFTKDNKIYVLKTLPIASVEEAETFFEKCRSEGEEGAMMKNIDMLWEPKRSKNIGKMKAEEVADLVVVAIEEGCGKYSGMMGALVCETSDGFLQVKVGTGFSDADRDYLSWVIGNIVEVQYNQKIQSKGKDTASLFLPRYLSVRGDKSVANSFEELK